MKHIFIVNPAAGKGKIIPALLQRITFACQKLGVDYEIHNTSTVGDATAFAKKKCEEITDETLRFYACGGDGTMNEVANALAGVKHAELAVIPIGTGNDFIKSFSHEEYFADIEKMIQGRSIATDIIKFNNKYSLNILNIGFDCDVVKRVEEIKRESWVPHGMAYTIAALQVITREYGMNFKVTTDTGETFDGEHLLVIFANAQYYGGGYKSAPKAMLNDGLMDICVVDKVSRPTFMTLLPKYKAGTHLDDSEKTPFIHYLQCKKAVFEAEETVGVCADGEISAAKRLEIEVVPKGINVVVPKGSKCTAWVKTPSEQKNNTDK